MSPHIGSKGTGRSTGPGGAWPWPALPDPGQQLGHLPQGPWEGRSLGLDQGAQLPHSGAQMVKVNISADFLFRLSEAKLASVYQTYVPGTVVSAFAGVISLKPQERVVSVNIPILRRGTQAGEVGGLSKITEAISLGSGCARLPPPPTPRLLQGQPASHL